MPCTCASETKAGVSRLPIRTDGLDASLAGGVPASFMASSGARTRDFLSLRCARMPVSFTISASITCPGYVALLSAAKPPTATVLPRKTALGRSFTTTFTVGLEPQLTSSSERDRGIARREGLMAKKGLPTARELPLFNSKRIVTALAGKACQARTGLAWLATS